MKKEEVWYQINWQGLDNNAEEFINAIQYLLEFINAIQCLLMLMDIKIDERKYNLLPDKAKRYFKTTKR